MIAATLDDRYLWIARAHHFGKDLRYKESLAPLLKAVELDPSDHIGWIHAASVHLRSVMRKVTARCATRC